MNLCQHHWDKLRLAIKDAGLDEFVATDGGEALEMMVAQVNRAVDAANFEPLILASMAITSNVMELLVKAGGDPLYVVRTGPEDPVEGYGRKHRKRTWPHCPLCYVNLIHELTCKSKGCSLDKLNGYDFYIDKAVGDQVAQAKELGLR